MSTVVTGQTISRFERQINRLKHRGIPRLFGVENEDFGPWLAEFGVTKSSLIGEKSFIGLPSGLIQPSEKRHYWEQLCPDLKLSDIMTEMVMAHFDHDLPTKAYILEDTSFDIWSKVAKKAVEDWSRLQEELLDANRDCLTGQELITLITYNPSRFDVMLALGSMIDGVVPCLEPISGYWEMSLHCLDSLMDRETGRWISPFGGAGRIVAPTAKRLTLVSV